MGQDPGDYALASYCAGAPPGIAAEIPPELGQPGTANQCWTKGCNGHNSNPLSMCQGTSLEPIDLNAVAVSASTSIEKHILSASQCKREM